MAMESDKIMFEVYREGTYTGKYRVVYYTELNENNKEWEINRAMAGEHFYDGFIRSYKKEEAQDLIESLLKRMNDAEQLQRFGGLVRLQPADPVEPEIRIAGKQRRPFSERLLHSALAEVALSGGDERLDLFRRAALADGDQLHVGWVAPRELRRRRDAVEDVLATICGAAHAATL